MDRVGQRVDGVRCGGLLDSRLGMQRGTDAEERMDAQCSSSHGMDKTPWSGAEGAHRRRWDHGNGGGGGGGRRG